jgi:effector-binding domain-containing protein
MVPATLSPGSLGQIAVLVHSPIYDPDALDLEVGYLLTAGAPAALRLSEERVLTTRSLPAVETMATLVHVGPVSDSHAGYGALGAWLERHRWQIDGIGRELLIQLPVPDGDDRAVMEIQLPVRRADEKLGA